MTYAFLMLSLGVSSIAFADEISLPSQEEARAIYDILNKGQFAVNENQEKVVDFVYRITYPSGGDCCEAKADDLFIHIVIMDAPNVADGYIVGVPSRDSSDYNTLYDVIAIMNHGGEVKAWPLRDTAYDESKNTLSESDGSLFRNLSFDIKSGMFQSVDVGSSSGYCQTVTYYAFDGQHMKVHEILQGDDCSLPMEQVQSQPKLVSLYKNPSAGVHSLGQIDHLCGMFVNPTPANAFLKDKDGQQWWISEQGGYSAYGDWPADFPDALWVKTNGNYGYGCACMDVIADKKSKNIRSILASEVKPLSFCDAL